MAKREFNIKRWTVLIVILVIVAAILIVLPPVAMPQTVVHEDVVSDSNNYTTTAWEELGAGPHEVWISESLFSIFNSALSYVEVERGGTDNVHVDMVVGSKDRKIEGDDCELLAAFEIDERDHYSITVYAPMSTLWTGSAKIYVTEARSPAYAAMQWSGALLIIVAVALGIIMAMMWTMRMSKESDARQRGRPQYPQPQPPPYYTQYHYPQQYQGQPPPPGYPPYPPPPGQPPPPPPPRY